MPSGKGGVAAIQRGSGADRPRLQVKPSVAFFVLPTVCYDLLPEMISEIFHSKRLIVNEAVDQGSLCLSTKGE